MSSNIFKSGKCFEDIITFFDKKNFKESPETEPPEYLSGKDYHYFEIDEGGTVLAVICYSERDELKEFEKELKHLFVDYMLLVKDDLSEYIFYKHDFGTGKSLKLKKKRNELEGAFLRKLDRIGYNGFESFEKLFDRSEFVKEFYAFYCDAEEYLIPKISGIPEEDDQRLYAKILMNRLMFLWFLQKKKLLDGDKDYFITKFNEMESAGKNYYSDFIGVLFFEGLCKTEEKRDSDTKNLIGDIPYLNGGLFIKSDIETRYEAEISIPNDAFYRSMSYPIAKNEKKIPVLNLLECKEWTVDEKGGEVGKLDPEILGYIFEKSINQKGLGAFYTPEEITKHICKNTIHPYIVERMNKEFGYEYGDIKDVIEECNRERLDRVFKIVNNIKILDPAVGSGHFLLDALSLLEWLYRSLRDKGVIELDDYQIRDHIITENLYGVDILEGGVETCKLRMFLSLAELFRKREDIKPLPNIDFNIRCGDSLIGYMEKLTFVPERKRKEVWITLTHKLLTLDNWLEDSNEALFNKKIDLIKEYKHAHGDDAVQLRQRINDISDQFNSVLNGRLLEQMANIGIDASEISRMIEERKLKPFHWIIEFPEIVDAGGADIAMGNPPWEIWKPNSQEFFSRYDSQFRRLNKQQAKKRMEELCKDDAIGEEWEEYQRKYELTSKYFRDFGRFNFQTGVVHSKKRGGDLNLYKLFLETFYQILKNDGYGGIVIPSGFYTDLGCKGLRELFFDQTAIRELYCFENRKGIFESIHRSFKFIILTFEKGVGSDQFRTAFMLQDVKKLETLHEDALNVSVDIIKRFSPSSYSVMEFKSQKDVEIAEKMYQYPLLGEWIEDRWNVKFTAEFHITNDSHLFNTERSGLPLYEGKMIWHYDHRYEDPQYWVEEEPARKVLLGKEVKRVEKSLVDRFLQDVKGNKREKLREFLRAKLGKEKIAEEDVKLAYEEYRMCYRGIAASTNKRSLICAILPPKNFSEGRSATTNIPTYFDVATLEENGFSIKKCYNQSITYEKLCFLVGIMNSFVLDYLLRMKITTNINMFYIYELPIPRFTDGDPYFNEIVERCGKLICTTPEFDDLMKVLGVSEGMTDSEERQRLQCQIDAYVARIYGIARDELKHILSTFPSVDEGIKEQVLEEFEGSGRT